MSKRLDELRTVDPVLTTIAQSYSNKQYLYRELFPVVKVKKMGGKIPIFGKEAFIVRETDRAIRAASNRIAPEDFILQDYAIKEKDIETAIDYLEEQESDSFYKLEQRIAKNLKDIIEIGKEKEAADFATDETNYSSDQKLEITALDAFDDSDSTDPIEVIQDCISELRSNISVFPNVMIIGESTFRAICNHSKVKERIKYTSYMSITKDILKALLDVSEIYIGQSVYSEDGETFNDIWQDNIVLAYVNKSSEGMRSEYNPSFGYTLQMENMPEIDTYFENGGKIKVVRNTDNYAIKVTSQDAAFLIYNTNHS